MLSCILILNIFFCSIALVFRNNNYMNVIPLSVFYFSLFFYDYLYFFIVSCWLFFFKLAYISCTKGFHCGTSMQAYNVLWSNSPICYSFLSSIHPPPFFFLQFLVIYLCYYHMYIMYLIIFTPQSPSAFTLPLQTTPLYNHVLLLLPFF
jgi:hypothetical protein